MSNQHTPGPWKTFCPHSTIYIEARLRGSTIQEVASCGPTETPEQQEANARLIAAAPELLEALEMGVAETMDYINRNNLTGAENNHWIVKARAAIAKATGESHE